MNHPRTRRRAAFPAFLFLLVFSPAMSARAKPGSGISPIAFEGKPSGARFIGLGQTGMALPGMPESSLWNPAAMHDLAAPVLSLDFDVARQSNLGDDILLHGVPLRGRKLTFVGFATTDASFFYRPLANFDDTVTTVSTDPLNNFTQESLTIHQFGFTAAQQGDKDYVVGINLSYLTAHRGYARAVSGQPPVLELADGNGFSVDFGMQYKSPLFVFGMGAQNLPGMLYWNRYSHDQLPTDLRAGIGFFPVPAFGILTDYERKIYRGALPNPNIYHAGIEWTATSWLQLRGGAFGEELSNADKVSYTWGFSIASPRGYAMDLGVRTYRVLKEKVDNLYLSILIPLPTAGAKSRAVLAPSTHSPGNYTLPNTTVQ